MKDYCIALFDLDGTVIDSGLGITNALMHTLRHYGIPIPERRELYKFVGPSLYESLEKYYGFSKDGAREAVGVYREYYRDKGIFEMSVYDGVLPLLRALHEGGRRVLLATSKPEPFAEMIIEHIGAAGYFDAVAGSLLDGSRVSKDEVIEYALGRCGISEREQVVMIGDRDSDILGAKRTGIASIGVLYGFGSREELEAAQPEHIAETPRDIGRIILGENYVEAEK